jgi:hypothetical protein
LGGFDVNIHTVGPVESYLPNGQQMVNGLVTPVEGFLQRDAFYF